MIRKDEFIMRISHCIDYSCESYTMEIYGTYREFVENSMLEENEKTACIRLLTVLMNDSAEHLGVLRKLKDSIERSGKNLY